MDKSKEKLVGITQLSNDHCILAGFVNESNSLHVGFRPWIKKEVTDQELDSIIAKKQEIELNWPNCEIKTAASMNRAIKSMKEDEWDVHPVVILAYGGMIYFVQKSKLKMKLQFFNGIDITFKKFSIFYRFC